jgi:hypothetical protein
MNQSDLIKRFKHTNKCTGNASNMFIEGSTLYSYGRHFVLAIKQDFGSGVEYLINGDKYSVTTTQHTNACIQTLRPNVQIPFSALSSARIDPKKLKIIDNRPDQYWYTCSVCGKNEKEHPIRPDEYTFSPDGNQPLYDFCNDLEGNEANHVYHHILGAVLLENDGKFYLSGMDENEKVRRSYFLCQLPKAVKTVTEAYDSLQPDEVKQALADGLPVKRQGDIFFVPSKLKTIDIKNNHTSLNEVGKALSSPWPMLYDTNHMAREGRLFFGDWFVRGSVRHIPAHRKPDHSPINLGEVWHVAVKNLALAAWSAVGNVD